MCLKLNLIKSRIGGILIKHYAMIVGTSYKQKKTDAQYVKHVHVEPMNAYVHLKYAEHVKSFQRLNKLKRL